MREFGLLIRYWCKNKRVEEGERGEDDWRLQAESCLVWVQLKHTLFKNEEALKLSNIAGSIPMNK